MVTTLSQRACVLRNRHSGETLALRRVPRDGQIWLELKGTMPPRQEGPPLHVHYVEIEEAQVTAGTLSVVVDGRRGQLGVGEKAVFPAGSVHRWWNEADDTLVFDGFAGPVVDLDRYLQAAFDVLNSGPAERPPMFYMAHLAWRHRQTQGLRLIPQWLQVILFPAIIVLGTLLGRYRGTDWPGCPARFDEAPLASDSET